MDAQASLYVRPETQPVPAMLAVAGGLASAEPVARSGRSSGLGLAFVLVVAAALRGLAAVMRPNIAWPDEVFQVVEPAHRLVFGNGIVAWEQVVGLRSWLFPGVVAAMLWIGRLFGANPALETLPLQLFMVAGSLVPVAVAYRWGERLAGAWGGAVVGGVLALWVDLIFFAPHPLTDVIAGDVLMGGLYAALPLTTRAGPRRLAIAGALFGLAVFLRIQLGPALAVAAAFACGRRPPAWAAMIGGGAGTLLACGELDWVTLGSPFRSLWLNLWLNGAKGVSDYAPAQPLAYYAIFAVHLWWPASIVIAGLLAAGRRRFAGLFWTAAALFVTLTLIPHKEWRYAYPALAPILTICAIATLDAVRTAERYLGRFHPPAWAVPAGALAIWGLASLLSAAGPVYGSNWTNERETLDAFALAARQPGLCGVGLVDVDWGATPGSAALPPGVPIYIGAASDPALGGASYNVAVTARATDLTAEGFRRSTCFEGTLDLTGRPSRAACVWVRGGGCAPGHASPPGPNWPPFFLDSQGRPRPDRIAAYSRVGPL
jgi:phosphatidylinositol glycan class B